MEAIEQDIYEKKSQLRKLERYLGDNNIKEFIKESRA